MGWRKRGAKWTATGRDGGDGGEANRGRSLRRAVARRRPSASLVISVVALFVALGGTGYAAVTITGKNVKDGSLTTKDIKNNSLTSSDVRDRSLRLRDFRSGELSGAKRGPAGPAGPAGAAGAAGAAGSAIAFARVAASGDVDASVSKGIAVVASPAGDGLYCLNDTAGTPKSIAVTIDLSGADSRKSRIAATAAPAAVASACPAPADIAVAAAQDNNVYPEMSTDLPFYVAVLG
ncbi:MAG: hypothetical protein V7607_4457 [Solirubrobacteraceae bacterium]